MLKLANQVIDIHDDVYGHGFSKLAKVRPDASVLSADDRASLPDHCFALSMITKEASKMNKFPIVDADSTWLSNEYFEMNHARLPKQAAAIAAHHIKTACAKHSLRPSDAVEKLAAECNSNVYYEEAKPEFGDVAVNQVSMDKLANVGDIANNYTAAQYAMPDAGHVKMACAYFEKYAKEMSVDLRHGYATAIQKRAEELGLGQQKGAVSKYASDSYNGELDGHLRMRASLLEGKTAQVQTIQKLGAAKQSMSPTQFAQTLRRFDKQAGLDRYYGGHLLDPYMATFGQVPEAYANYHVKTASGKSLSHEDINNLASTKIAKVKEYFGSSIADEMAKDPVAIFESLPMDAKEVLAHISEGTL
jgi:hypothetical protein